MMWAIKGCLGKKTPRRRLGIGAEISRTEMSIGRRKVGRDWETRKADLGKGSHGVFWREEEHD